jgi:Family of unknown function (DUF6314)
MRAAQIFHSLAGDWRLSRSIPDQGTVRGLARFRWVEPAVLAYHEEGTLQLDAGATMDIRREYRYVLEPDQIRVMFAEPGASGDTLHVLRPATDRGDGWPVVVADVHLCGEDTYVGEYRFESDSRIAVRMQVQGPAKDYLIATVLDRVGPDGGSR